MKKIKYTILYGLCENFFVIPFYLVRFFGTVITVSVPLRSVIKLRFRFRYGINGSGSAKLPSTVAFISYFSLREIIQNPKTLLWE
jgi:hypothetical protein